MQLRHHRLYLLTLVGALAAFATASACAADHEGADRGADVDDAAKWGVGLGVGLKKSPYKGIGTSATVLPLFSYENNWIRFFGTTLDAKLPSIGDFDFSLRAKGVLGGGYKSSKSDYLTGMQSRTGALYFGAATTYHAGLADLSLDILGSHKGSQLKLGVERSFVLGNSLLLTPHASWTRFNGKYVDYYFGVRPGEATADRPEYKGESTSQTDFGLRLAYQATAHQRLLLDVSDQQYGKGITDSPLVEKKSTPVMILGYTYNF